MNFSIQRESLLKPLQIVCSVVERRQTLPILSHVLLSVDDGRLSLAATDLEVEMLVSTSADSAAAGEITLPARKFLDICRTVPDGVTLEVRVEGERASVRAGRSRFTLATLPATEFPSVETSSDAVNFNLRQQDLKFLLDHTHFAMAQQDVRYYLNGLLLHVDTDCLRAVATDGHRLALCELSATFAQAEGQQLIVPRKAVMELIRLLEDTEEAAGLEIGSNYLRVTLGDFVFTSKLIDGRFPDYQRVLPKAGDKVVTADRELLKQALTRVSILSNEKYRGIRLQLAENLLRILANNPEQEEAEDEVEVRYDGGDLEIGFNVNYLLDALSAVDNPEVQIDFTDSNSSCLIRSASSEDCRYVVMPMRL